MATTPGKANALRYRSYVYDTETALYYLQSRYYNPGTGRFINTDDVAYLGADGTPISYNLFAYCKNNPVLGYDPSGHWDWELVGKIVLTTIVVAGCLTGIGAIAAAAATAVAASVTTAVTVAVTTAAVSTTFGAIDGAICAKQSGGKWYDGAMAGAIGGSIGALVSTATSPKSTPDSALRMNTLGRAASSLVYDVCYDWFSSNDIDASSAGMYAIDVTMDTLLAPTYYYYSGSISTSYLSSAVSGLIDAVVDVFQTVAYFS